MWEYINNPVEDGKYFVAVNSGGGQVSYEIGYWANDLSKLDPSSFKKNTLGWYYAKAYDIIIYEVIAWMKIPQVELTAEQKERLRNQDYIFDC